MSDFWSKLDSIVSAYLDSAYQQQTGDLRTSQYRDLPYPMDKYGTNLTSAPNKYLHKSFDPSIPTKPEITDKLRGLNTLNAGAETDARGKIRIRPFDPDRTQLSTLIHEMEHRRQARDYSIGTDDESRRSSEYKGQSKVFSAIQKRVADVFSGNVGRQYNRRIGESLSGQTPPDEIVAQLKAYEALLPAGMTLLQSPLGQKIFPDNQSKLWWLQSSEVSMTDQTYLEGLAKKEAEQKGKK